jgi:TonB family protein
MSRTKEKYDLLSIFKLWISGKATIREERKLESIASEDEFLRDAMQGYTSLPDQSFDETLLRLRSKLQKRTKQEKRGFIYYGIRVAASLVVLVAAWLVIQTLLPGKENAASISALEENASRLESSEQSPPEAAAESGTPDITSLEAPPKSSLRVETRTKILPAETPAIHALTERAEPLDAPLIEKPVAEGKKTEAVVAETNVAVESVAVTAAPSPAPAYAKRELPVMMLAEEKSANMRGNYRGKVTDADGMPLAGASVNLKGTSSGAVTDQNGTFSIQAVPASRLVVSYLGFESREVSLGESKDLNIVLQENQNQLSDVVVANRSRSEKAKSIKAPEPENGFRELEKYLAKSMVYPAEAESQNIRGKVRLRFQVRPDGTLDDFFVLDSLGYGCDEEAIRLLKNGPKWKPEGRATYEIQFQK